ncbi:ATP phosphoribosyltransferase [Aureimonas frigidaquae]|uniref:ATP phosphoribosyltransferase n=1 Tax=Aureimonas frigidaquae TaxID=424757 RepID=UPI00078315D6|nr:ATP phosphoribosyltransferase [Aureimonas frigidaquae]
MSVTLAIPSKGRLKDQTIEALAERRIFVRPDEDSRSYRTRVDGCDGLDVLLLSASEIARELRGGSIHLGVTGEDLLRETLPDFDGRLAILSRLGFGHADVVVAVPDSWVDVATMEDLSDVAGSFRAAHGHRMRIATKYWRLTQSFFTRSHGIQTYRIVESLGATEGAPAAGSADIIVDITSTGSTLTANRLRVLSDGLILSSQACLAQSLTARTGPAEDATLADIAARFTVAG